MLSAGRPSSCPLSLPLLWGACEHHVLPHCAPLSSPQASAGHSLWGSSLGPPARVRHLSNDVLLGTVPRPGGTSPFSYFSKIPPQPKRPQRNHICDLGGRRLASSPPGTGTPGHGGFSTPEPCLCRRVGRAGTRTPVISTIPGDPGEATGPGCERGSGSEPAGLPPSRKQDPCHGEGRQ